MIAGTNDKIDLRLREISPFSVEIDLILLLKILTITLDHRIVGRRSLVIVCLAQAFDTIGRARPAERHARAPIAGPLGRVAAGASFGLDIALRWLRRALSTSPKSTKRCQNLCQKQCFYDLHRLLPRSRAYPDIMTEAIGM